MAELSATPKEAVVQKELEKIHGKYGFVTPKDLVDVAADPRHRLHRYFEWDDSVAARRYRLEQAEQLIRVWRYLTPTEGGESRSVRALIPRFDGTRRYFKRSDLLHETTEREIQVERAKAELRSWVRRWSDLDEFAYLRGEIRKYV